MIIHPSIILNKSKNLTFHISGLMRIRWNEAKRQQVLAERNIDFAQLQDLLYEPYIEDQRSVQPEQYRIIGFANGKLTTFIVEYRISGGREYTWVVTAWNATKQERKSYETRIY